MTPILRGTKLFFRYPIAWQVVNLGSSVLYAKGEGEGEEGKRPV